MTNLFWPLKKLLEGKRFASNEEVKDAVQNWLRRPHTFRLTHLVQNFKMNLSFIPKRRFCIIFFNNINGKNSLVL